MSLLSFCDGTKSFAATSVAIPIYYANVSMCVYVCAARNNFYVIQRTCVQRGW